MDMGEPSRGQGAVASGTGTGMTPRPATAGALSFVSGDEACDEETIVWTIKNFAKFFEMSNEEMAENGIIFEAGHCILMDGTRTRAAWKYHFEHTKKDDEDWVGAVLQLQNDKSNVYSAKATAYVSVSSGGKTFDTFKASAPERKDGRDISHHSYIQTRLFAKSKILENTKATDVLEVSLLVKAKVFSGPSFKPVLQNQKASSTSQELVGLRRWANSEIEKSLEAGDGKNLMSMMKALLQPK